MNRYIHHVVVANSTLVMQGVFRMKMKEPNVLLKVKRILGAALFLTLGCATSGANAADVYKFAASPTWYGHVPVMVAIENGYFEEEGVNVEFSPIFSSSDRLAALTAGSVSFTNLGRVAVISEMSRGNDAFYFIANIDDSPGAEGCWGRPGIDSAEAMRGKKVAAAGSSEITMTLLLQAAGMSQKDIELINIAGTEMAPALSNGDIDAACIWQPLLDGLKSAVPDGHLIGTDMDTDFYAKYKTMAAPDIVVMSKILVDESPEVAAKIVKAMFRGADFASANPAKAAELVSSYFNKPASELIEPIQNFQYFGAAGWQEHMQRHEDQMQALSAVLHDMGKIGSNPDVKNWAKTDFIK